MTDDRYRARDSDLLDALDRLPRTKFEGTVWRVVHFGRDPVQPSRSGGRWDLGGTRGFDVLYTACECNGAIAEMEYHLSLQPVFPSKIQFVLFEIRVVLDKVIRLESLATLSELGVDLSRYYEPLYDRTQQIGDAVAFLACDGLLVPNARWACQNLVVFTSAETMRIESLGEGSPINWNSWRKAHPRSARNLRATS